MFGCFNFCQNPKKSKNPKKSWKNRKSEKMTHKNIKFWEWFMDWFFQLCFRSCKSWFWKDSGQLYYWGYFPIWGGIFPKIGPLQSWNLQLCLWAVTWLIFSWFWADFGSPLHGSGQPHLLHELCHSLHPFLLNLGTPHLEFFYISKFTLIVFSWEGGASALTIVISLHLFMNKRLWRQFYVWTLMVWMIMFYFNIWGNLCLYMFIHACLLINH